MNRSKLILNTPIVLALVLFSLANLFAQQQAEVKPVDPSCDVTLQVVIGTNEGAGQPLPAELGSISRLLKSSFQFTNYRVAETFLGRVGNRGFIEYKSVINLLEPRAEAGIQTFFDWSLRDLRTGKDANDKALFQAESFRFGGRVPVKFSPEITGREAPVINYESIGLNLQKLTIPANTPTLIGTITMTKAMGTMFVVITVKPAL